MGSREISKKKLLVVNNVFVIIYVLGNQIDMKSSLLCLIVTYLVKQCAAIKECDCMNEKVEPICCLDMDYNNECEAKCNGITEINECQMGECQQSCICSQDFEPLCCDKRNDYNNECLAECMNEDLDKCEEGTCASIGCGCQNEFDPYCCNGQTFENSCVAECNGKKYADECNPWVCEEEIDDDTTKSYFASYSAYNPGGLFLLTSPSGTSQWNIMIVIIQLCIFGACCMTFGICVSFCFENGKRQSFK